MQSLVVELAVDTEDNPDQMVRDIVAQVERIPGVSRATATLLDVLGEESPNAIQSA